MSGDLVVRATPADVAAVAQQIDFSSWANALINGTPYVEPDRDYLNKTLLLAVLTAETAQEVLSASGIGKLQQMVADAPGASTGPLEFTDLYVTGSDFGEGMPCYVIASYIRIGEGTSGKFTTGAGYLQSQLLALLNLGVWPITGQVQRIDRRDRGGRHLFQLFPVD